VTKGSVHPPEWRDLVDAETGLVVRQLTGQPGHSHPLYFTNSGWYDDGRRLLFAAARGGATNLFGLDLRSGAIAQLTDLPAASNSDFLFASVNPVRPEAYFWQGPDLVTLDLETLRERRLYRTPDGYSNNMTSVTADGRYLCTAHYEDLSGRFPVDLLQGYVGFTEYWKALPHSMIRRIDLGSGRAETVFEEKYWIGHVNASPTVAHIATFCHEGPWQSVDNRIWALDLDSGRHWPIRQRRQGEAIGHEYWLADGMRIGFQGRYPGGGHVMGAVRYNDDALVEFASTVESQHIHSHDLGLIVGDGTARDRRLLVWRCRDGRLEGPRALAHHGCAARIQITHVHPRFSPDGRQVLFASDRDGHGNLYVAELPAFESLPELPATAP
jgi:oligogalacturonide lyase